MTEETQEERAERLKDARALIDVDVVTLMAAFGMLCLGLRHPKSTGPAAERAGALADMIAAILTELRALTPEQCQAIRNGTEGAPPGVKPH